MRYQVDFDVDTKNILQHSPPQIKLKLKQILREICHNPYLGKILDNDLKGYFTYSVRKYRILYALDKKQRIVNIVAIGPRSHVYEEFEVELRLSKKIQ